MSKQSLHFPYKCVPSILRSGLHEEPPSIDGPKAQNTQENQTILGTIKPYSNAQGSTFKQVMVSGLLFLNASRYCGRVSYDNSQSPNIFDNALVLACQALLYAIVM